MGKKNLPAGASALWEKSDSYPGEKSRIMGTLLCQSGIGIKSHEKLFWRKNLKDSVNDRFHSGVSKKWPKINI